MGYQGTAGLIHRTPVLYSTTPQYFNLQRTRPLFSFSIFSFSFCVSLILCLLNADRQNDTQCSREGRAFVPGIQFVLVLLCFTVQAYISKQPRSSCFQNQLQDAFFSTYKHTQTHIHVGRHISVSLKMLMTESTKTKVSFLEIYAV